MPENLYTDAEVQKAVNKGLRLSGIEKNDEPGRVGMFGFGERPTIKRNYGPGMGALLGGSIGALGGLALSPIWKFFTGASMGDAALRSSLLGAVLGAIPGGVLGAYRNTGKNPGLFKKASWVFDPEIRELFRDMRMNSMQHIPIHASVNYLKQDPTIPSYIKNTAIDTLQDRGNYGSMSVGDFTNKFIRKATNPVGVGSMMADYAINSRIPWAVGSILGVPPKTRRMFEMAGGIGGVLERIFK